jgi:N-acyl-D-aspartate/D-glutamate deacylase
MSGMPARRFGLRSRGLIREGYFADLVVFDFDHLASKSTFEHPQVYPEGISLVVVNGEMAVENGRHTRKRAGRVLRRS